MSKALTSEVAVFLMKAPNGTVFPEDVSTMGRHWRKDCPFVERTKDAFNEDSSEFEALGIFLGVIAVSQSQRLDTAEDE